jgi:hypothetical protein
MTLQAGTEPALPTSRQVPAPRTLAYAMAGLFSLTMLWFTAQGFMLLDDYELQGLAYQAPWLDLDYLTQPWGGHFMPAGFALAQVLAKTTPFTYLPMALLITAGMTIFAFASARLMIFLFGNRWRTLAPLGLLLVSGAVWDSATWWIAALNAVPLLMAIPLATMWHISWLRDGSLRAGLLAWLTVVIACLFFEKAIGLVAFLALLTLALRGIWSPPRPRGHAYLLLGLYAGTVLGVSVTYVVTTTGTVASAPDIATLASFLKVGGLAFPALVLGGPWAWAPPALAATPLPLAVLALNAVLVLALWQSLRSRRATLLWVGMLVYVLAVIAIVASGRALWGVQVIAQPRYFSEAVVYAVLIACIAWAYLEPAISDGSVPSRWRKGGTVLVATVVIQGLLTGLATTLPALSRSMLANPSRAYVVGSIEALDATEQPILNGLVPGDVMWPLVTPRNQLRFFFSPLFEEERFPDSLGTLEVLNAFGFLRPGTVLDPRSEASAEPCPWLLRERETVVPLPSPLPDYWHTVKFSYLAGAPTSLEVRLQGGQAVNVPINSGLHEGYAFLQGSGEELTFSRVPDGVGVCLSDIAVGFPIEKAP